MAESLVEELLKLSGNKVYRFGYEAVLQNLTQLESVFDRESEVGQRIKSIPDFVVINRKGKPVFIEVKFRTNLKAYADEVQKIKLIEKFWHAKVVLVTVKQPYFRVSYSPYLNRRYEWDWIPLEKDKDLGISPKALAAFEKYLSE